MGWGAAVSTNNEGPRYVIPPVSKEIYFYTSTLSYPNIFILSSKKNMFTPPVIYHTKFTIKIQPHITLEFLKYFLMKSSSLINRQQTCIWKL